MQAALREAKPARTLSEPYAPRLGGTAEACAGPPLRELIAAATLAPSPDNNQPWRFAVRGGRLVQFHDRERALRSDVHGMFDLMALGAAAENVRIAATAHGYNARIAHEEWGKDRLPDADRFSRIASFSFARGAQPDPLLAWLAVRCTCRRPYSRRPVPAHVLAELLAAASSFANCRLSFIADRARIGRLAPLVAAADGLRFQHRPFHEELYRQLRFSAGEAERTRDGLDLRTFELPPGAAGVLRWLRPWSRMRAINRLGLTAALTAPTAALVRRSGAIGVLTVSAPVVEQFFEAGRALERVWLTAARYGLGVQPLGSLPIFVAREGCAGWTEPLAARARGLIPELGARTLAMLFRLGYAHGPSVRSLRRPVEEVFEEKG